VLLCALHGLASTLLWWASKDLTEALTWHAMEWQSRP